jgi:DnaJ-class molecular chaperone
MAGKGNYSSHGENGDLLVKVNIRPHPYFKRDGSNIQTEK